MLGDFIRFIVDFFLNDVPDEMHREHEEKYGIPGQAPGGRALRNMKRTIFIITCIVIAAFVLAIPVILLAVNHVRGM